MHFMWILYLADYSHEMLSCIVSEKSQNKTKMLSVEVVISTLRINGSGMHLET